LNKVEVFFYDLVKANPRLKVQIRNVYQRLFDLVPAKRMATAYEIEARRGFFFGFHDKCPWSVDDKCLLAHRVTAPFRMPRPDDEIEVGFFSGEKFLEYTRTGSTRAWNWHMGAMLQWVGHSDRMLYNDFDGQRLLARIVDQDGRPAGELPAPVAALSSDGAKALSYDFPRLQNTPHKYGYANGTNPEADQLVPSSHGIHIMDVNSGTMQLLFSVADIRAIQPEPSMEGSFHYFSHCQFAPSGGRFAFYHRWRLDNEKVFTRLISSDLDGNHLHVFPTSGMVSHYGWRGDTHVLAYAKVQPHGDGYYLFEDRSGGIQPVGRELFTSDGHPSFAPDHRRFITDTYPDRYRVRLLVLYDMERDKRYVLSRIYSPPAYRDGLRCDLHPRWSRGGTMICFDSAHTGERTLCTVNLEDDLSGSGEPCSL
jgi:hypothetical protein